MIAPEHRIRTLGQLKEMIGQPVFLCWNAVDYWTPPKTQFSDTNIEEVVIDALLSPRMLATRDDPIHYGEALRGRTTYILPKDRHSTRAHEATLIRVSDFNFGGRSQPHRPWWAMFRTREEAELWNVFVSLSIPARCPAEHRDIFLTNQSLFSVLRMNIEPTIIGLTPYATIE
jgi:hypothetical protein